MKHAVISMVLVLGGCSSKTADHHDTGSGSGSGSGSSAPVTVDAAPPPLAPIPVVPTPELATLVTADVVGVLRAPGDGFPIVDYVTSLLRPPPACWTTLRAALKTGYQLELASGSYIVFEGELPRADVETCVTRTLTQLAVSVTHEGELSIFKSIQGETAAAWRGSLIVAGTRAQVASALAAHDAALVATWRARLAALPAGPLVMSSTNQLVGTLFGVPTTSYVLAFDRLQRTPKPMFAGHLVAVYADAKDAKTVAATIKATGVHASDAPPAITTAFKRLVVKQTGATLEAGFDSEMFAAVDIAQLQRWLGGMAAHAAPPVVR